jgi:hypothetical protein
MGDTPIYDGEQQLRDGWSVEASSPDYFVVDDQTASRALHHHVEVQSSSRISPAVIAALASHVEEFSTWSVGIAVPKLRYFFLNSNGIWFLDAGGSACSTLDQALALPAVAS